VKVPCIQVPPTSPTPPPLPPLPPPPTLSPPPPPPPTLSTLPTLAYNAWRHLLHDRSSQTWTARYVSTAHGVKCKSHRRRGLCMSRRAERAVNEPKPKIAAVARVPVAALQRLAAHGLAHATRKRLEASSDTHVDDGCGSEPHDRAPCVWGGGGDTCVYVGVIAQSGTQDCV
jgi:hypothetical protein